MPTDWQTASARNDRERSNRTRQNAEDLFKPKPQTTRADVPNDDSPAEYQPRRQPRIFAIPPVVPMSTTKVEPAAEPKQIRRKATTKRETPEISASQFGRVRAFKLANIPGKFDAGALHTQADSKEGLAVAASVADRANHAGYAAFAKSARHQNRVQVAQPVFPVGIVDQVL